MAFSMQHRICAGIAATILVFGIAAAPAVAQPIAQRADGRAIPGIAGHFTLETAGGREVSNASFPGKWLVIYFGYTLCPDTCPTVLNAISAALAELGSLAVNVQPVFITVDPQRDTPRVVADYVKAFDPRMLGLSGTDAQTAAAAKAFHVYYAVRKLGGGEYAIDHSSFVYIVDPGGRVVELLAGNLPAPAIAATLRNLVK